MSAEWDAMVEAGARSLWESEVGECVPWPVAREAIREQYRLASAACLSAALRVTLPEPCPPMVEFDNGAVNCDRCGYFHRPTASRWAVLPVLQELGVVEPITMGYVVDAGTPRARMMTEYLEGEFRVLPPSTSEKP